MTQSFFCSEQVAQRNDLRSFAACRTLLTCIDSHNFARLAASLRLWEVNLQVVPSFLKYPSSTATPSSTITIHLPERSMKLSVLWLLEPGSLPIVNLSVMLLPALL